MLIHVLIQLLVVAYFRLDVSGETSSEVSMPFDYFLGPEHEELARERPLPFNPDEGHDFRKVYEDKYGYRGERLIAMLGGGSAPLSIFDASLLGKQSTTTTTSSPSEVTSEGELSSAERRVNDPPRNATEVEEHNQEQPEVSAPVERKYVEIDRKHNGFLAESFLENNIPQEETLRVSPDGVVYKRLYSAIWNYGANGLPNSQNFKGSPLGKAILDGRLPISRVSVNDASPNRATPGFLGFDGGLQLPSGLNFNGDFGGFGGFPSFYNPTWTGLDAVNQPSPYAKKELHEEDLNKTSQKEYAGPGEPSILVESYSYR